LLGCGRIYRSNFRTFKYLSEHLDELHGTHLPTPPLHSLPPSGARTPISQPATAQNDNRGSEGAASAAAATIKAVTISSRPLEAGEAAAAVDAAVVVHGEGKLASLPANGPPTAAETPAPSVVAAAAAAAEVVPQVPSPAAPAVMPVAITPNKAGTADSLDHRIASAEGTTALGDS
jgi:hypothetical protein